MNEQQIICIGIIQNKQQQLLISRRQKGQHLAGKWEFPGGKLEAGESLEEAMQRELKEEVGVFPIEFKLFESLDFQYPDLDLTLHFFLVTQFEGIASAQEGQQIKWVSALELTEYEFPKANLSVINKLL